MKHYWRTSDALEGSHPLANNSDFRDSLISQTEVGDFYVYLDPIPIYRSDTRGPTSIWHTEKRY